MSVLDFKFLAGLIILLVGLICGLYPLWHMRIRPNKPLLSRGNALASGIFLGAALFHMLPDANKDLASQISHYHYPYANILCAGGFVLLLFIERLIRHLSLHRDSSYHLYWINYILVIVLSIHSLIEGMALGVNLLLSGVVIIFIAIIAHKGFASFALAMNLNQTRLTHKHCIYLLIIFALMTPIGIALGSIISSYLMQPEAILLEGIFNAFAAGTFLYIATLHTINGALTDQQGFCLPEISALLIGLIGMALVAVWV